MLKSDYIEDLFVGFYDYTTAHLITLQHQDKSAATSFYSVLTAGKQLTKNQASFILKILDKYKIIMIKNGIDYTEALKDPKWKTEFRVLDLSKKIYVEKDDQGEMWVCAKFPFSLKEEFNKDIIPMQPDTFSASSWDHENRVRRLKFYDYNLISIYEFAMKHTFEIDDSFMIALADVEEIWQGNDKIVPHCEDHFNHYVLLRNALPDTEAWWNIHKTDEKGSDLLLAKSMGFPLKNSKPTTLAEKIASSDANQFWLKSNEQFIELYREVGGPVAVILDKGSSSVDWVKQFYVDTMGAGLDKEDLRVCFRLNKDEDKNGFNQWVKDHELGGPVEGGKIFIFQQKPPKWLFSQDIPVKIILTNSLYPLPSNITQSWMDTHTCVCFLGEIKASKNNKDKKIVEL